MTQTAELLVTRIFDAPRELIFECITDPEQLTQFWGPAGMHTPLDKITVDLRLGGVFETVMVNDETGEEFASRCVYTEIDPPSKIVWTEPASGLVVTTDLVDLGDGRAEVRIHQTNLPDGFPLAEVEAGFNTSLDRFDAYLANLPR